MTVTRIVANTDLLIETFPLAEGSNGVVTIGTVGDRLNVPYGSAGTVQQAYVFPYDPATAADNVKAFTITNSPSTGFLYVDGSAQFDPDGSNVAFTKIMGWRLKIRRITPNPGAAAPGTITLTTANWPGAPASFAFDCAADMSVLTDFFKSIGTNATLTLTASAANCGLTAELILLVAP